MKSQDYLILIVDDEQANVYLLSRMLRGSYRIAEAHGGEEALAIARSHDKPALILLDVMMPEIDGFEVCRRLKAEDDTKDIIVIFVTAIGDSAAEELGLNLGAADYITKPISLPIVRARVRNQINMRLKADMLEAMSYIDGLTHVYNRRKFDTVLQSEWQRAAVNNRPLALIMIDFDHFKALNDCYGHGAGDICLQQGAAALSSALRRQGDLLARYGGEEFVALLPDTDIEGAAMTAEAMRAAVKALKLEHRQSMAADHVTVSLGVASMIADPGCLATDLLELADRALNFAKTTGRDRVVLMDEVLATDPGDGAMSVPGSPPAPTDDLAPMTGEAADASLPRCVRSPAVERRRHAFSRALIAQGEPLPQPQPALDALRELYRLPLSAELHAELDSVHGALSDLVERLESVLAACSVDSVTAREPAREPARELDPWPDRGRTGGATMPDSGGTEHFDRAELLRRLGGDVEIAEATVEQFLTDAPERLRELRVALAQGNQEGLRFKAHSLKGLAGAISAVRLQRLTERLEQCAVAGISAPEAQVADIEREYLALEPLLREEFGVGL